MSLSLPRCTVTFTAPAEDCDGAVTSSSVLEATLTEEAALAPNLTVTWPGART